MDDGIHAGQCSRVSEALRDVVHDVVCVPAGHDRRRWWRIAEQQADDVAARGRGLGYMASDESIRARHENRHRAKGVPSPA